MRTFLKRLYKKQKAKYAITLNKKRKIKLPSGVERIYHVHIRKSAGTSVNSAFWALGNLNLKKVGKKPLAIGRNLVFVRNNKNYIEEGHYFFGNSHMPFWSLQLPENTFTFCVLRDPYERLVSLYKYYIWIAKTPEKEAVKIEPYYYTLIKHVGWLGDNFSDFIDNLPERNIANQLFMFSENYNVEEALQNIEKVNKVYFQEKFDDAIQHLSTTLGVELHIKQERNFGKIEYTISEKEKHKALLLLKDEYEFYYTIKKREI